jgi:hypothetical protein
MKPRRNQLPASVNESAESEITIQPDGRVFAFGITRPLVAVLATIPTSDERTKRLLRRIGDLTAKSSDGEPSAVTETQ